MAADVVLRRSVGARLFSGFWLQPILTMSSLLTVGLFVGLLPALGTTLLGVPTIAPLAVLVPWALGVTAGARADAAGVRWRLFRNHAPRWSEIEQVRFGSVITAVPGAGTRAAIFVRAGGIEHPIVPAYDCRPAELTAFATGLVALAAAHDVPAVATSGYWDGVARLPGVARGEHQLPGRIVSHDLKRLRMRLTGLAFLVVTACAWAGSFAGWQTNSIGERVAFGIIGLVLLLVGLLLLAFPSS